MKIKNIETCRLILIPVTLEITAALLEGKMNEVEKLGIRNYENWPTKDTMDILPIVHASLEKNVHPTGFEFWMIVKKENRQVIGDIGFHGKPNEKGEVEVGFGLVEDQRRKGYGTEALLAMMDWIRKEESVKAVIANCLLNNAPSARILQKAGLHETGRDNEFIYWQYTKPVSREGCEA
ncbi:MAG: GNAT family N-acetyltransferase [Christensenellales bacterium]